MVHSNKRAREETKDDELPPAKRVHLTPIENLFENTEWLLDTSESELAQLEETLTDMDKRLTAIIDYCDRVVEEATLDV